MAEDGSDKTKLSPKEARELIAGGEATVIDINTDEEWGHVGNIAGALRVDADDVESRLDDVREETRVIVVCNEGERSAEVAEQLRGRDIDAVSIEGGMLAWEDEGLPLQPSEDPALPSDPGSVEDELATGEDTSDEDTSDEETSGEDERSPEDETASSR